MTRRGLFALPALALRGEARSKLGVATTSFLSYRKPKDTIEFLEYAHGLGAAGIQAPLASLESDYVQGLRRRASELEMYLEVMAPLPQADMTRFVRTLEAAKEAGALCVRSACLSGRRYETFATLEEWKAFAARSRDALARAIPVANKLRIPLALENHKDWTVDEMLELLKAWESPCFGVCLDTGNNIALLDDPKDVVERLAPYAVSTHIKDMGVAPDRDGFLLSEVVLGEGILDIPQMMATIASARPQTRFTLEMITRDPLRVPALTDKYWATFPDRGGRLLARTLRLAEERKSALPRFSHLRPDEQLRAEEENVRLCLRTAPQPVRQ